MRKTIIAAGVVAGLCMVNAAYGAENDGLNAAPQMAPELKATEHYWDMMSPREKQSVATICGYVLYGTETQRDLMISAIGNTRETVVASCVWLEESGRITQQPAQ